MSNELLNPVVIAQNSLIRLENDLTMTKMVNREFENNFAVKNEKIGYTYNARLPVRYRGRRGDAAKPEATVEQCVPVQINELWGQDLQFSDQDLTLTIDRFGERYVEPASAIIANMIDGDLCDLYRDVFSHVGSPGTVPTTMAPYASAGVELQNNGCPQTPSMLAMVINPEMQANALGFNANLFNPQKEVAQQYLTGKMGPALGFKWNADQNVARHTIGAMGTAGNVTSNPAVLLANQTGATINTDGWDANITGILKKGDIVSFTGVYGVNPISYRNTGRLRSFLVTADCDSSAGGVVAIPVAPDINADPASPFQTVTALPADNAIVKVFGVTPTGVNTTGLATLANISVAQALAFHRDAFTLAVVKQELPGGMEWSEWAAAPKSGLGIRLVRGYLIGSNEKITRLDVLGGVKTIRPELGCRVSG
jgi:hypothetical protein